MRFPGATHLHVFCDSYQAAQSVVFRTADFLDRHQKLSLNRQKTKVLTVSDFEEATSRMLIDDPINQAEREMLAVRRKRMIAEGREDELYTGIEITHLSQDDVGKFTQLLIEQVLAAYLGSDSAHYIRLRWFLRRLAQVGVPGGVEFVAKNIEAFAPAIVDAVRYLGSASKNFRGDWSLLGGYLLGALDHELLRANEYLQAIVLRAFADVKDLNNAKHLIELYPSSGPAARREITLATAAQGNADWLRQYQGQLDSMDPWLRRATYFAMSELPEIERLKLLPRTEDTIDDLSVGRFLGTSWALRSQAGTKTSVSVKASVAIITALPIELAAMRSLMVSPRRETANRSGGMRESYLGKIPARGGGFHDVILALSGMGNNSAAARTMAVMLDYPSVRCVLMVGIAGGCPNPSEVNEHVRLGDIVVSGDQGVLQYDFVKQSVDKTTRRFRPRPPSATVLEAARFLQSEAYSGTLGLKKFVSIATTKLHVKRPSPESDKLETGDHPIDSSRVEGQPKIFVGPIGSANILLKDPRLRDELRAEYGVRAIEMEGSGIADAAWELEIGYMVIRGVCDYCDKNKSDLWQPYAAVVASAYARLLLESIPRIDR